MFRRLIIMVAVFSMAGVSGAFAQQNNQGEGCSLSSAVVSKVIGELSSAVTGGNGGLNNPNRMWAALVDRQGVSCNVTSSDSDAWPGSRAMAIAKATTANAFSSHTLALSTANLNGPTQPGGSLYGLNNSNPFNPACEAQGTCIGVAAGGIITFGGVF